MPLPSHRAESGAVQLVLQFLAVSVCAGVLAAGLVLPVAGGAGYVARSTSDHFEDLPSGLATPPLPERSRVLAADGSVLATFYSENRIVVPLRRMAKSLRLAVVAIEDSRFYEHHGLDVKGTTRALLRNTTAGDVQQGGSTLTQQYVKNVLLENADTDAERAAALEQSISRKLQELRYAVALEKKLTKPEILERYLNIAYFGSGAYGAEVASRHYFDTSAAQLRLHQAALLAGIIRLPGAYDPIENPDAAMERRNVVLDRMADLGMISADQAQAAQERKLGLNVKEVGNGCGGSMAPFFCDYIYNLIKNEPAFGKTRQARQDLLYRGGLTIHTTLSPKAQRAARRSVSSWTNPTDAIGGAIAMIEPGTGRVKAMAQNHRYGSGGTNTYINYSVGRKYGGSSGFQAGSTFKPFVLATALRQGLPLSLRMRAPTPYTIDGFQDCKSGADLAPYEVNNYSDLSYGSLDMRQATWRSVNTYFVQLEERTGICEPVNLATRMGLRRANGDRLQYNPSFVLGTDTVTPLGLAEAFATFAARGRHCEAVAITRVTDRNDRRIDVPRPHCRRVLNKGVADAVNSVLEDVITGPDPSRTGAAMDIGRPAAGKTGTTSNTKSVWFAGYTPQLASAVWVGYPRPKRLENVTVGGRYYDSLCGGCLPGPIWRDAMSQALSGLRYLDFVAPADKYQFGDEVTVPDVRGLSVSQARAALGESGVSYVVSSERVPSNVPAGLVAGTSPEAGAKVPVGTTVTIEISNGQAVADEPSPEPTPGTGRGGGGGGGDQGDQPRPGKPGKRKPGQPD